jgi:hypothetical protein
MFTVPSACRWRSLLAGAAAASLTCAAGAAEVVVHATQEPAPLSSFTLNFGAFGETSATITQTQFDIAVDSAGETARFTSYNQQVQPLTLPGGVSTGDITVQIVPGSSAGTFTRGATLGRFHTAETYRIFFTGDLSLYGMTSPVDLPGASNGEMAFGSDAAGVATLVWDGATLLPNPFDPQNPINLTYRCEVHADFAAEAPVLPHDGDLNCDGGLNFFDIDAFVLALFDPAGYGQVHPACDVARADINDGGAIEFGDIDPFVNLLFE